MLRELKVGVSSAPEVGEKSSGGSKKIAPRGKSEEMHASITSRQVYKE